MIVIIPQLISLFFDTSLWVKAIVLVFPLFGCSLGYMCFTCCDVTNLSCFNVERTPPSQGKAKELNWFGVSLALYLLIVAIAGTIYYSFQVSIAVLDEVWQVQIAAPSIGLIGLALTIREGMMKMKPTRLVEWGVLVVGILAMVFALVPSLLIVIQLAGYYWALSFQRKLIAVATPIVILALGHICFVCLQGAENVKLEEVDEIERKQEEMESVPLISDAHRDELRSSDCVQAHCLSARAVAYFE